MKVAVQRIFEAPKGLVVELEEPLTPLAEDVTSVGPIRGVAYLQAEGRRIHLRGEAAVEVLQVCGRCLREFTETVRVQVEEVYEPGLQPEWGGELGAEDFVYPVADSLDLVEIFRQHLLLALPPAPLCRPDCAGLCPICGADRNLTPCGCVPTVRDPRLAVLERFRVQ